MNTISPCEDLDAYLNGELAPSDSAAFQEHLSTCDDCRDAVNQQQWIDGLLHSPEREAIEPPPKQVMPTLISMISRPRHRRVALIASGLAAALLAMVASWDLLQGPRASVEPVLADATQAKIAPAMFIGDGESIVVPVASKYPDIAIVRVYAAYRPADQDAASPEKAGSDEVLEHKPFNGG